MSSITLLRHYAEVATKKSRFPTTRQISWSIIACGRPSLALVAVDCDHRRKGFGVIVCVSQLTVPLVDIIWGVIVRTSWASVACSDDFTLTQLPVACSIFQNDITKGSRFGRYCYILRARSTYFYISQSHIFSVLCMSRKQITIKMELKASLKSFIYPDFILLGVKKYNKYRIMQIYEKMKGR